MLGEDLRMRHGARLGADTPLGCERARGQPHRTSRGLKRPIADRQLDRLCLTVTDRGTVGRKADHLAPRGRGGRELDRVIPRLGRPAALPAVASREDASVQRYLDLAALRHRRYLDRLTDPEGVESARKRRSEVDLMRSALPLPGLVVVVIAASVADMRKQVERMPV